MSRNVLEIMRDGIAALMEKEKKSDTKTIEMNVEVELADMKLENGTVIVAEAFEPGQPVQIFNEEGNVPLPVGDYVLETGQMLIVAEEGMIAEIKDAEPEEEVEQEAEFVTMEVFNAFVEEVKQMLTGLNSEKKDPTRTTTTKVIETLEKQVAELSEEKEDMQAKLDEKPDAEIVKHAPVELKEVPAKTAQERIVQKLRKHKN